MTGYVVVEMAATGEVRVLGTPAGRPFATWARAERVAERVRDPQYPDTIVLALPVEGGPVAFTAR